MKPINRWARLKSLAYFVPEKTLDNERIVAELGLNWTAEEIFEKTGVRKRHIVDADVCASDIDVYKRQA